MRNYRNSNTTTLRGLKVEVHEGQFEKALRKFKKKVTESGLLQDLRDREFYTKPTTARKKAKNQAKRRWQKKVAAEQLPKKLY
jgi:small subunit ribosomal protein S21